MPVAPTHRMRTLAARWLTDSITLSTVTFATDTRPLGKATTTETDACTVKALVRQPTVEDVDTITARRDVRDLRIWVEQDATPTAGQRCTITTCADSTLVGKYGEVITVERDSIRAVRRITVRIANDD